MHFFKLTVNLFTYSHKNPKFNLCVPMLNTYSFHHKIFCKHKNLLVEKPKRLSFLDYWFDNWIEKLKSNQNLRTDWKNEKIFTDVKYQTTSQNNVLFKLANHSEYIPGFFENASSLCDYIEENRQSTKNNTSPKVQQKNTSSKNPLILTLKIALTVHQKQDHEKAFELYKELCKDTEYLHIPAICAMLISALAKTTHWKECLKLLEVSTSLGKPTSATISAVMVAAFKNHEMELFEALLKKLDRCLPPFKFFEEVIKLDRVDELLELIGKHSWVLNEEVADALMQHYSRNCTGIRAEKVKINNRICKSCGTRLDSNPGLTGYEMEKLRQEFVKRVLVKRDVYLFSNPQEIKSFQIFLESFSNYDVVIDSLNVVYVVRESQNPDVVMRGVIEHFLTQGMKVLVLSRMHLQRVLKRSLDFDKKKVQWFFTENSSHDDVFALYACFNGRHGCALVSRDMLRSHNFHFSEKSSSLFTRWQEKHQIAFLGVNYRNGSLIFRYPKKHGMTLQRCGDVVHVPCRGPKSTPPTLDRANLWLCVRKDETVNEAHKEGTT